ncbi:MAG: GumC family protein [Allosphingosinicella sp.]|uniref:GumC family protein n=1 Tax=Allosphingosinicella sp. TaxID=2823234 RepID=UPI003950927C
MNDEAPRLMMVGGREVALLEPEVTGYRYPTEPEARPGLDFAAIWRILYRNKLLIAVVCAASILAGLTIALFTAPAYRAVATIQIDQQTARILNSEDVQPEPSAQEAERFLQTQVDILRSRSLATRVAERLNLYEDESFLTRMRHAEASATAADAASPVWREHVTEAVQDNLSIVPRPTSRIVKIQFSSPDAALAATVANSFAENYITSNLQRRFDTSAYSRDFLQGQLAETKRRLEEAERELIAYARQAGLIDASAGVVGTNDMTGPRSLTTANLVQLNQAYAQASSARIQAQQRWAQAQATPLMSLPEVLSNPTVQQLTQRRAEFEAQYQEERQRRKEEHPAVIQSAARIAELDRQINTLAGSIRGAIAEQYRVAQRQEQALLGSLGRLKSATLAEQDRGVRYNILKREVDTSRELYEGLLQRYREVSAAAGIATNNVSIIDRAEVPLRPYWPRPMMNMALGGIFGIVLSFILVVARENFDDRVHVPEDVERKLGLPLLGMVPLLPGTASPAEALANPRSMLSEAYATIRTSVELSSSGGLPATILLTSSRAAEGKSTTSYGLSRQFAQMGKRVLLIDSDLRKPSLHRLVGAAHRFGLSNVLAGQKRAEEVLQQTDLDGLHFMASGSLPPNPPQLLGSPALKRLLHELEQAYDVVVIDGPPLLGLADALLLSAVTDVTIFVVEGSGSSLGQTKAALRRLLAGRGQVLGAILTKFNLRSAGYDGYGYYSYAYGKNLLTDDAPRHVAAG